MEVVESDCHSSGMGGKGAYNNALQNMRSRCLEENKFVFLDCGGGGGEGELFVAQLASE